MGQGGDLSPYCKLNSLYFDNSLYENEMHYRLAKYLEEHPLSSENEELLIKCDNEEQFNSILDSIAHFKDGKMKAFGTSRNPMEIIVEEDPRAKHRHFDEKLLLDSKEQVE